MTRIAVLGAGQRAAQIGCEFALGGCSVVWPAAGEASAASMTEDALRLAAAHGLAGPADVERARALASDATAEGRVALILEAGTGNLDLDEKAKALGALAAEHPEALVATASGGVPITELGEAAGVGERIVALRYGEPPLLQPVVEMLAARDTPPRLLDRISQLLRAIGKRPVTLRRELAGTIAERVEVAVLRECLWLLERGVADSSQIDEIVRDGLARTWAVSGPLQAASLEDLGELARVAAAIGHDPAAEMSLDELAATRPTDEEEAARGRRDAALAAALRAERTRGGGKAM